MKAKILIGLPGAGKSTYRRQYLGGWLPLSTDDIIEDICCEYATTYSESFSDLIGYAQKVFDRDFEFAVNSKFGMIVIDRTNLSRKSRKHFIDKLKKAGYHIEAVVIPIPDEEEWKRRLASRPGKFIPTEVIRSMMSKFEMPTTSEGFDLVTIIE